MAANAPLWPIMVGTYLEVEGCFGGGGGGAALVVSLGGDMNVKIVDGFVMAFETGFTLVLVNVNGLGGGGGRGADRNDGFKQVFPSDVKT